MDYRKELDALMAETVALTSRTPSPAPQESPARGPQVPIDLVVSILSEPNRPARSSFNFRPPEREQINKRVESFKAHQERFRREREDYCQRMMKRVRDAVEGRRPPDD